MLTEVFGRRGSGKTTMIRNAIDFAVAPVVVVDILGNFDELDAYHAKNIADAVSFVRDYKAAEAAGTLTDETSPVVVLQAPDPNEAVDYMSSVLMLVEGGTLVLDEVDAISTAQNGAPVFDQVIRYGRNRNVNVLTGCRRPAEVDRNLTAGANRIYIFQTTEPRDIEYFRKGILGDRADGLVSLDPYHGIFLDYDKMIVGTFMTNETGEVFHLTEEKLNL